MSGHGDFVYEPPAPGTRPGGDDQLDAERPRWLRRMLRRRGRSPRFLASTPVRLALVLALVAGSGMLGMRLSRPVSVPFIAAEWPDASNTGVPSGTSLTAYTGSCTISTPGTIIDAKTITCAPLTINALNVSITRSLIIGTVDTSETIGGANHVTLTDSEIQVGDVPGTAVGGVNFTLLRVEITGGNRSVNCWDSCLVEDSYVHGQMSDETGTYHESGIRQGSNGVIRHNRIVCDAPDFPPDAGCSASLTGYGDFATVHDMTIDNNYIMPTTGGYCAYGGSSPSKPFPNAYNMVFTNNLFGRRSESTFGPSQQNDFCGYYGTISDFNVNGSGNVWSGNHYSDQTLVAPA